ncbi:hypothetical protein TSMEX_003967 [Taenia solium]|eukprot:TsM_000344700 transcript=TsM_000344700 gene=TsM_000344700
MHAALVVSMQAANVAECCGESIPESEKKPITTRLISKVWT